MPDGPTPPGANGPSHSPGDGPSGPTGGGQSHPSRERLRAHLDDRLPTDEAAEVAAHLETCEDCVAALDDLSDAPVLDRSEPTPAPTWDERRMRRSVRRTLLRTAIDAALLLVVGTIVLQFVGALVLQPLLVNRGDRVARSVAASIDVPVMTIPGAQAQSFTSNHGVLRRTTEVEIERAVGSRKQQLGTFSTRLGPIGMSTPGTFLLPGGEPRFPGGPVERSRVAFDPDRLGDATAATVQLTWGEPIATDDADAMADPSGDVALLWVGFAIRDAGLDPGADLDPGWLLGYSACGRIPEIIEETGGLGGFGSSGTRLWQPGSGGAEHALDELRRATANLAELGWPDDVDAGALADPADTARWLDDEEPGVTSVVLTGPTSALAAVVDATEPDLAHLLEVDFDRAPPEPCG